MWLGQMDAICKAGLTALFSLLSKIELSRYVFFVSSRFLPDANTYTPLKYTSAAKFDYDSMKEEQDEYEQNTKRQKDQSQKSNNVNVMTQRKLKQRKLSTLLGK